MISPEEAFSLINKWNQESAKLRCMYVLPGFHLMFVGTIDQVSPEAFGMRTLDKESWVIVFRHDLSFVAYGDHRMVSDDPMLKELALQYEGFLVMITGDGHSLTLGEIKP